MPFIQDVLTVIDLAVNIFDEQCPQADSGLRKAITAQLQNRMPAIIKDQAAWQEYSENKVVLKALHTHVFIRDDASATPTSGQSAQSDSPPTTPVGTKRRRVSQFPRGMGAGSL